MDLRRIVIIFVIAVLSAVLVNSLVHVAFIPPDYQDFCSDSFSPKRQPVADPLDRPVCPEYDEPAQSELDACAEGRGMPKYSYDSQGCVTAYTGCDYCQREYDAAQERYSFWYFIVSSILSIIGIVIALYLPTSKSINEWIATGIILGGLFALFFGTIRYYEYLGRFVKPLVILIELAIVIYLSYKKLADEPKKKK